MTNLRYTQLIAPLDRYVHTLSPRARKLLALAEGLLFLLLTGSVLFYVR